MREYIVPILALFLACICVICVVIGNYQKVQETTACFNLCSPLAVFYCFEKDSVKYSLCGAKENLTIKSEAERQ
jgi:hypothetical protein